MSLYNTGMSGLNAAQALIQTTSHNIDNSNTVGFHRQSVSLSSAGGQGTAFGFIGNGVQTVTVMRDFDRYQYTQLLTSQGKNAQLASQVGQLSSVDNSLSNVSVGISAAMSVFFTAVNKVATSPSDPAARQELVGNAESLASQVRSLYSSLQSQREGINTELTNAVGQVNSLLDRVNQLNTQIVDIKATANGQPPNDLLDQRDQAVSDLNDLIGVTTSEDAQGRTSITMNSGAALLSGSRVYPLEAIASAADPQRTVIAYTVPDGVSSTKSYEMADSQVRGGKIGGLTQFRSESLDVYQNRLGQLAIGLAQQVNEVHKAGKTPNGDAGTDFFSIPSVSASPTAGNSNGSTITGIYGDASKLTTSDYNITFDGTDYNVTRLSDNASMGTVGVGGTLTVDGVDLTFGGTPAAGDSWTLSPTRNAAEDFQSLVKSADKVAAADSAGGTTNGNNAKDLAALQTKRFFDGGLSSVSEQYSQTVNIVAVQTSQAKAGLAAQTALVKTQQSSAQGGVDLNAETISLTQYQNFYSASSRIIDAASKIFDTLLGLRS